jgi:cytoskeletal protein CcmA (bactofilin family)
MRALISLIYLFILFLSSFIYADERKQEEHKHAESILILPAGAVHNGDYFASARTVEISGTVNGDVYLFAEQVLIDGVVNGDILCCAGSIDISGKVTHNCRILGGQVLISGEIGNNVTVVAGNLQLLASSSLGGNFVATAGNVDLAAKIASDATVLASNLRVSSQIGNDLLCYVGQMRMTSKAVIGRNLEYRSNTQAWIEPGATVGGMTTHHPSFVHELVKGTWIQSFLVGSKIVATLMNFIYSLVIGVILIRIFPKNLEAALHELKKHPLKALSYGLMFMILLPLACLLMLMTILGIPFALTLIALNIIGFYTAKVYCIIWASNWTFGRIGMKTSRLPLYCLGLVVYFCLTTIPIFGTILSFAFMVLGLGAGVLSQGKRGILNVQTPETSK